MNMATVDPVFGIDNYNRPKALSESESIAYRIMTLLYGKPGFYPSIPTLGMNIQRYLYSFEDDFDVDILKAELARQCQEFLPQIQYGNFDIIQTTYNEQPMLVFIIPTILTGETKDLVLGVTMTKTGEFQFNFVYDKDQYLS